MVSAHARDYVLRWDTGYLAAIGPEAELTEYATHTWPNNTLSPTDSVRLQLDFVGRLTSSFWTSISVQFLTVRFTIAGDDGGGGAPFASWIFGEHASPNPPPPPGAG